MDELKVEELLRNAESLQTEILSRPKNDRDVEEQLKKGLIQLNAFSKRLGRFDKHDKPEVQAATQLYFASHGFDFLQHADKLKTLDFGVEDANLQLDTPMHVDEFVEKQLLFAIADTIREMNRLIKEEAVKEEKKEEKKEWQKEKTEILSAWSLNPYLKRNEEDHKQLNGSPKKKKLDIKRLNVYKDVIMALGEKVKTNSRYPELPKLLGKDIKDPVLSTCWRMFSLESPQKKRSKEWSRQFMELEFKNSLTSLLRNNREIARRGGQPGFQHSVRAYLNVLWKSKLNTPGWSKRFKQLDQKDFPLWPQIFYALRCGEYRSAITIADGIKDSALRNPLQNAIESFSVFEPLQMETWHQLAQYYDRYIKGKTNDPYLVGTLIVLSNCDSNPTWLDTSPLYSTQDDFIWCLLCCSWVNSVQYYPKFLPPLVKKVGNNPLVPMQLEDLQQFVREKGENWLSSSNTTITYFHRLLQTLQFESAINFLFSTPYKMHAVHFAICLDRMQLIQTRTSSDVMSSSRIMAPDYESVDLASLLETFVKSFQAELPELAFCYVFNLRLFRIHEKYETHFKKIIVQMLIQTKKFDVLIGIASKDSSSLVKVGSIFHYLPQPMSQQIIRQAAKEFLHRGEYVTAVKLHWLNQEFETVGKLLMMRYAQCFHLSSTSNQEKKELSAIVEKFLAMGQHTHALTTDLRLTYEVGLFFDAYHKGPSNYQNGLLVLSKLDILPDSFEKSKLYWDRLPRILQRNIGHVLLAVIKIYHFTYSKLKKQQERFSLGSGQKSFFFSNFLVVNDGRIQMMTRIREKTKSLLNFHTIAKMNNRIPHTISHQIIEHSLF